MTPHYRRAALAVVYIVVAIALAAFGAVPAVAQTPSPSPSPSGSHGANSHSHGPGSHGSPSPSPSQAQSSPSPSPSQAQSSPSPRPAPRVLLDVGSPVLLGQVGDLIAYSIRVEVDEPADEVVVVASIAPELNVESVPLNDAVAAMSSGRHGDTEDIVWVLEDVAPNHPIDLVWYGRVAQAGDMEATTVVEARTGENSATDAAHTFLASAPSVQAEGIAAPRVAGKVVRFVPVAAAPDGSLLPVTGWSPSGTLWLAFALIVLGALLIGMSILRPRQVVTLLLTLLVTAACTTSERPEPSSAPPPSPQDEVEAEEKDPKPKDQVLGIQIRRDPQEAEAEIEAAEEAAETDTASTEAEPVDPPITYRRIVVPGPPVPEPLEQPSATGDNTVAFEWDEAGRSVVTATSGIVFSPDQLSSITTTLEWGSEGLESTVELTNTSSEPLRVQGILVLEIVANGTVVATLDSEPIDVILDPDGSVRAGYRYLLPSGEYLETSKFQD